MNHHDSTDLRGRTVLLTGASSGIGAEAARQLFACGSELVLVGRDLERLSAIAAQTGATAHHVDFAELGQVRALATTLLENHRHIDVLFNNAGGMWRTRTMTADGLEQTIGVNAVAPLLLTRLLEPALVGSRVIATTSITALRTRVSDLDDLAQVGRYEPWDVYAASKLVVSLVTREFARRWPGTEFAHVHPGVVTTSLIRGMPGQRLLASLPLGRLKDHFLDTPRTAAESLLRTATHPDGLRGDFFDKGRPAPAGKLVEDEALAARTWQTVCGLAGLDC